MEYLPTLAQTIAHVLISNNNSDNIVIICNNDNDNENDNENDNDIDIFLPGLLRGFALQHGHHRPTKQ